MSELTPILASISSSVAVLVIVIIVYLFFKMNKMTSSIENMTNDIAKIKEKIRFLKFENSKIMPLYRGGMSMSSIEPKYKGGSSLMSS